MMIDFLKNSILRHLEETELYLKTLQDLKGETLEDLMKKDVIKPDEILFKIPAEGARPLGEVILHMIRSLEYYVR